MLENYVGISHHLNVQYLEIAKIYNVSINFLSLSFYNIDALAFDCIHVLIRADTYPLSPAGNAYLAPVHRTTHSFSLSRQAIANPRNLKQPNSRRPIYIYIYIYIYRLPTAAARFH